MREPAPRSGVFLVVIVALLVPIAGLGCGDIFTLHEDPCSEYNLGSPPSGTRSSCVNDVITTQTFHCEAHDDRSQIVFGTPVSGRDCAASGLQCDTTYGSPQCVHRCEHDSDCAPLEYCDHDSVRGICFLRPLVGQECSNTRAADGGAAIDSCASGTMCAVLPGGHVYQANSSGPGPAGCGPCDEEGCDGVITECTCQKTTDLREGHDREGQ